MPRSKLKELIDEISNEQTSKDSKNIDIIKEIVIPKSIKKATIIEPVADLKTNIKSSKKKTSVSKTTIKTNKDSQAPKSTKTAKSIKTAKTTKTTNSTKNVKSSRTNVIKKSTAKKSAKKSINEKITDKSKINKAFIDLPEYYDLPYRYNQTIVKVLAQSPHTLFVYWDISDDDIVNLKNAYGDNFFDITKPVLVVHNITENYSFEVEINDFANNWYIHVNNTKCKYIIELGRRSIYEKTIKNNINNQVVDFINVSFSNTIEMPNDHVLFFKANDKVYFKNIKTNEITQVVVNSKIHQKNIKAIYKNFNLSESEDRFDFRNPSSQNPTSNFM